MPTEKPRITFTVNPETLSKIDDYRYSHKMKKSDTGDFIPLRKRLVLSFAVSFHRRSRNRRPGG